MLSSLVGPTMTAKEKREERAAQRLYRQEQTAKLNDMKSRLTAYRDIVVTDTQIGVMDPSGSKVIDYQVIQDSPDIRPITKDDRAHINTYIDRVIAEVGKKKDEDLDLYLEGELPKIMAMEESVQERVALFVVSVGSAKNAAITDENRAPSSDGKKLMLSISKTVADWLADEKNRGLSPDEIRTFKMNLLRDMMKDAYKKALGKTDMMLLSTIALTGGLTRDDVKAASIAPDVVESLSPPSVDVMRTITRTIFITLLVAIALIAGMLAANDAIGRPVGFRVLNFIYGGLFFIVTIPYYLIRWFRGKSPRIYSMLPLYRLTYNPTSSWGELFASLFAYVEDDYYVKAVKAFRDLQASMI